MSLTGEVPGLSHVWLRLRATHCPKCPRSNSPQVAGWGLFEEFTRQDGHRMSATVSSTLQDLAQVIPIDVKEEEKLLK